MMFDGAREAGIEPDAGPPQPVDRPRAPRFLDGLPVRVREELARELRYLTLPAGRELFRQGERGDELFILLSGRLRASARDQRNGQERELGTIAAGEPVGEMALLSGRPRSATVVAERDSELAVLDRPGFARLIARCPVAVYQLTAVLADRLERAALGERLPPRNGTVALIPLMTEVPMPAVLAALRPKPSPDRQRIILDRAVAVQGLDWFHRIEQAHRTVIYAGEVPWGPWTRFCLRQADHVLLLASAAGSTLAAPAADLLRHLPSKRRCDLVMLHEDHGIPARSALRHELADLPRDCCWNLRLRCAADRARLRRVVERRAVGLVLSGGGARGFCHLGVIRALDEAGVPLDLVGGTSMGALVAATCAMGWPHDETRARLAACFVAANPLNDYTLPVVALTRGAKLSHLLREHFGETEIEDLARPFFALAANLTTGHEAVLRRGLLRRALRATLAIPGLLPPAVEAGDVLADGGLVNNLPVRTLHDLGRGPVIGVDVGASRAFTLPEKGLEAGGFAWWWRHGREPGIAAILQRAATLGGEAEATLARGLADVVLGPPVEGIGLLDWGALERASAIGYRYAKARIDAGALADLLPAEQGT